MKILLLGLSFLLMHCISDTSSSDGSDTNQKLTSSSSVLLSSVVVETTSSVGIADIPPSSGVTISSSSLLSSSDTVRISSESLSHNESSHVSYDPTNGDTQNQNGTVDNTVAITQAQAEGEVLREEFKALRVDDSICSSDACISKRVELDAALEKLDGLIESNYYAHTHSSIVKYEVTSITDDTLFMVARDYWCEDGAVEEMVDTKQVAYGIESEELHLLIGGCSYMLFSGSSPSLLGNWSRDGSVYTSTEFDCYREYDSDISYQLNRNSKVVETVSVTETEMVREYTYHYNCWVDDLVQSYKEYENYTQYDCNRFEYMEYGLKTEVSYQLASQYIDGTVTYTYKGESCTESRKMYMDTSIKPDCNQPDCYDELIGQYCDDLQEQKPSSASEEYTAWRRALNVCGDIITTD